MTNREEWGLRPLEKRDLERLLVWRNSDRIRANMYTDHLITRDEHEAWFARVQSAPFPIFMIFEHAGRPLGCVGISQIDTANGRCHWGFYIGEETAPAGSGMKLGFLGLEYLFETLKFRKVIGEALAFNEASIKFHKKLGFKQEGRLVRHVLKNGVYEDVVVFALFEEDWLEHRSTLEEKCFSGEKSHE